MFLSERIQRKRICNSIMDLEIWKTMRLVSKKVNVKPCLPINTMVRYIVHHYLQGGRKTKRSCLYLCSYLHWSFSSIFSFYVWFVFPSSPLSFCVEVSRHMHCLLAAWANIKHTLLHIRDNCWIKAEDGGLEDIPY